MSGGSGVVRGAFDHVGVSWAGTEYSTVAEAGAEVFVILWAEVFVI